MPTAAELFKEAEGFKREGKTEAAIAKLEAALALDEKHVLAHMTLAVLLGKIGKHNEAIVHSQRACELEPLEVFNWSALSTTYQKAFETTQDRQYIFKAEEAKQKSSELQWQQQ